MVALPGDRQDAHRLTRISVALFLAGFSTFSLIYCAQPLLPVLARAFGVEPAESSLAMSLTTAGIAFSILAAGGASEALGRRGLMVASMALAAVLNILAALAPSWGLLLTARLLEGVALGGVPAVAMAYVAEETPARRLGLTMGLYVGGTAFGGMIGRVAAGALASWSWRVALIALGLGALLAAMVFWSLLPVSRNFAAQKGLSARAHLARWGGHLSDPRLLALFLVGFLALGAFMAIYNYLSFRLSAPPYGLSPAAIGLIFLSYLGGVAASSLAGGLADRLGRPRVLLAAALVFLAGLALTLADPLMVIILGVAVLTIGFFGVHSIASGWVSRLASANKGHAASLYLLSYYLGASTLGSAGGWPWRAGGWPLLAAYAGALVAGVCALAVFLRRADPSALRPGP
jgi:YNFM family putative membrane transporter